MIYRWSEPEAATSYIGKTEADSAKLDWYNPTIGVPLVDLDSWSPPLLVPYCASGGGGRRQKSVQSDAPKANSVNLISDSAAAALRNILDRHATLYPVTLEDQPTRQFFMVVVKTTLDCLDRERSKGKLRKYGARAGLFAVVENWVFDADCIGDSDMFVLPDSETAIFVSENFKNRIASAGLKGFCLKTSFWDDDPWIS